MIKAPEVTPTEAKSAGLNKNKTVMPQSSSLVAKLGSSMMIKINPDDLHQKTQSGAKTLRLNMMG